MPIRWYGNADTTDPTYQHFARIVNFTLHAMAFAAFNSGLWFIQQMRHPWPHLDWFSEIWLAGLCIHLAFVVVKRPKAKTTEEHT